MAEQTTNYVCKSCGGNLKWNIRKQSFECESCHAPGDIDLSGEPISQHPLSEYKQYEAQSDKGRDEVLVTTCKNCGAQIEFGPNVTATTCPMCGSPQIDTAKQAAGIPPDGIIPFCVDRADAGQSFRKWVKSRWFAPNKLKEAFQEGHLDGVYLPFWTYDSESDAQYFGRGGTVREEEDDEGHVYTYTDWTPVSGYVRMNFDDLLICDGSERAQSTINDFDVVFGTQGELARPYNPAYLSGVSAEHYTDGAPQCFNRAETKIESALQDEAHSDIIRRGYDVADVDNLNIQHHNVEYKQMLLPAWLSAFAYKGKQYTYMINGETGEVTGHRPYSIPKIAAAVIAALLLCFVLYNVFFSDSEYSDSEYSYYNAPTIVETAEMNDSSSTNVLHFDNTPGWYNINAA